MRRTDVDMAVVVDRFGGVLDDIDKHLLEKRIVQVDNRRNRRQIHDNTDITVLTDRLHKALAGENNRVQRLPLGLWLGDAHNVGKVGDEMAHAIATFDRDTQHLADVFRVLHLAKGGLERVESRSDARRRVVHLVRDHPDHLLVGFLLGLENFLRQYLNQIEGMMEAAIYKR